jgi:hypothetical protein
MVRLLVYFDMSEVENSNFIQFTLIYYLSIGRVVLLRVKLNN